MENSLGTFKTKLVKNIFTFIEFENCILLFKNLFSTQRDNCVWKYILLLSLLSVCLFPQNKHNIFFWKVCLHFS